MGCCFDGEDDGGKAAVHFDYARVREGGQWWHMMR
jgi:hypothetical protein